MYKYGLEIRDLGPPRWYGPPKPWPLAQRPTIIYYTILYYTIQVPCPFHHPGGAVGYHIIPYYTMIYDTIQVQQAQREGSGDFVKRHGHYET